MKSSDLVDRWNSLTYERLPELAEAQGATARESHCLQTILLDNAVGAKWSDEIPAPAYLNAPEDILRRAIALGEAVLEGTEILADLAANSLAWRGK